MILPQKPKRRRNETRDLVKPILAALNRIPGCRFARNNTGELETKEGSHVRYGLGTGSPDIVGIAGPSGRACCLEVKWPGKKPTGDQLRSARVIRSVGGFCSVVHSVEEAIAAVDRCRKGLDQ